MTAKIWIVQTHGPPSSAFVRLNTYEGIMEAINLALGPFPQFGSVIALTVYESTAFVRNRDEVLVEPIVINLASPDAGVEHLLNCISVALTQKEGE